MGGKNSTKVLIVDDTPANLLALEVVLESPQYVLVKAGSGEEALALAEREDFATIVLDLHMPGLDGYETARLIKCLPHAADIPIIFMTAVYKESEDVLKGYEVGAIDFISKPFDPKLIRTKVSIYTDLYVKSHQLAEQQKFLAELKRRHKTEAKLKAILETVPAGVLFADALAGTVELNPEAQRIWGERNRVMRLEEYNKRSGKWVEDKRSVRPEEWALEKALSGRGPTRDNVIEIETFDGKRRIILDSASPLEDRRGTVSGAVAVIQEVTRVKALLEGAARTAAGKSA